MRASFLDKLKTTTMVADGAMGTLLQSSGLQSGDCPEEWNVSHHTIVSSIHQNYYQAGADFVETNSFGGNRFRLAAHGYESRVSEFNKKAAELARQVCPDNKFVAGSVGPTGEFLQPIGTVRFEQMVDVFCEQIDVLASGGVDLILIETMMDLEELRSALQAAKKIAPTLPVITTMTFTKTPQGFHTMMGIEPKTMAEILPAEGADIIGANCGQGMEEMTAIMSEFRKHTDLPLLAQANAGIPEIEGGRSIYKETPAERGAAANKLLELGVNIIGGCCGTTPAHIQAVRKTVDSSIRKI